MQFPTISIVIPTKNEARYLPTLLKDIQKQTLQPFEVIVADASSTDETRKIAKECGARVVDGGLPSVGRNRGAAASTGELILFLDADVLLFDEQFLEKAVKNFLLRDLSIGTVDVGVVGGNMFDVCAHNFYNAYVRLLSRVHAHAPGFCILVRREMHELISGFDERIVFCEDHDYALRASKKGAFGILDGVKVFTTTRRQERDGRLAMTLRYIAAEFHILFLGPILHNGFRYGFGYDEKK